MNWTREQVEPWITSVIEAFGALTVHVWQSLPIDDLSHGFDRLYDAYERIVAAFSDNERDAMFRTTALNWFGVPA